MLLVSSSIERVGATMTRFFVGVGRERFGGGGDGDDKLVPLTTAAIVSEIAEKQNRRFSREFLLLFTIVFSFLIDNWRGEKIARRNHWDWLRLLNN